MGRLLSGMEAYLHSEVGDGGNSKQVHGNPHDMAGMPQSLAQIVKSDRLPTLPSIALRVIELAREPEPDFREVADVIRTDPALSGRLLRTANSALFGLGKPVTSVESAIPLLGLTLVRTMVLGFALADHSGRSAQRSRALENLWRSSLTQAVFAEQLAAEIHDADPATYFLAALLQDIGILSFLHVDPENYLEHIWDRSEFPDVVSREREHYGFSHVELAMELLDNWGLPVDIQHAIGTHHQKMAVTSVDELSPLARTLQAAALCGHYVVNHRRTGQSLTELVAYLKNHFGWTSERVEAALCETMMRVVETASIFQFDVGEDYSHERILRDAKDLLEQIALSQHAAETRAQALGQQIMKDPLTGTYNRMFMDRGLNDRLATAIRRRWPIGLMFVDIDRFKQINDQFGHRAGDEAIVQVASTLQKCVRRSDVVVRYGGDEFLVALSKIRASEFESICEQVQTRIREQSYAENGFSLSISLGAVIYQPEKGDVQDANWLIDRADRAMYEAKRAGGDQVSLERLDACCVAQPMA